VFFREKMSNESPPTTPVESRALSMRLGRLAVEDGAVGRLTERMVKVSSGGLPAMLREEDQLYCFTRRRQPGREEPLAEGKSLRYSAIVALGGRFLDETSQRRLFAGQTAGDYCGRLLRALSDCRNLGDAALVVWAAAEAGIGELGPSLDRLRALSHEAPQAFTVEAAWALSAFVAVHRRLDVRRDVERSRDRLLAAFPARSAIFPHFTAPGALPWYRSHVGCFADQVYPIQALARYHHALGDPACLEAASRCADRICRLQGAGGQWWWHYDSRTGDVVEGYPVYSVHQDAMGPMALLDLKEAGGPDHGDAIRRGLRWMEVAPEIGRSLVDEKVQVIWRKVARREPRKMMRMTRSVASRLHPSLRLVWLDRLFPPVSVDYESRPYHLGWVLFAWLGGL
jgi:hypothetical protein